METIFATDALSQLAATDLLVAFDFDGTLAPIVPRPEDAAMRSGTRRLLAQVAQLYPCAVISGRTEQDVMCRLGGVTVWYVIGNRFLEPPEVTAQRTETVRLWRPLLQAQVSALSGVHVEDKGSSIAVHYRAAAEHERARQAILAAAALLERVRVVSGKEVVNLLPDGGPDKGVAVERLRGQIGCASALYVGDDQSDEDAFALPQVAGVRVGEHAETRARWYLRDQEEIDALLERLVALRSTPVRKRFEQHPPRRRTE